MWLQFYMGRRAGFFYLTPVWVGSPCVIVSQPGLGLQRLPMGHAQWQSFYETQVRLLELARRWSRARRVRTVYAVLVWDDT